MNPPHHHVVFDAATGEALGAAGICDAPLVLSDDVREGPVARIPDDEWTALRARFLAARHSEYAALCRRLRWEQARLRSLAPCREVTLWWRPGRDALALGWASRHVAVSPPGASKP